VDEGIQLSRFNLPIATLIEALPADIGGGTEGTDARSVLGLLTLEEPEAGAEHLAGVLIPACGDQ